MRIKQNVGSGERARDQVMKEHAPHGRGISALERAQTKSSRRNSLEKTQCRQSVQNQRIHDQRASQIQRPSYGRRNEDGSDRRPTHDRMKSLRVMNRTSP